MWTLTNDLLTFPHNMLENLLQMIFTITNGFTITNDLLMIPHNKFQNYTYYFLYKYIDTIPNKQTVVEHKHWANRTVPMTWYVSYHNKLFHFIYQIKIMMKLYQIHIFGKARSYLYSFMYTNNSTTHVQTECFHAL